MIQAPKYKNIKESVMLDIRSGKLQPGDKLPVRTELMEIYDTTRATVDKALSELVDERILMASRRAGTFVASQKQLNRIALIAYVGKQPHGQIFLRFNYQDMYGSLQYLLEGRPVEIFTPDAVTAHPELLESFQFILSNPLNEKQLDTLRGALKSKPTIIPLNRPFEGYSFVSTDHRRASQEVTGLFLEQLPPDSEFIYLDAAFPDPYVGSVLELRKNGFIDACAEHRRFYRLVKAGLEGHLDYIADISELKKLNLSKTAKTCIISPSKCFTGAVLRFLHESGLTLDKDVYYADFDNYSSQMDTGYAITSVLEDFTGIAKAAVDMIDSNTGEARFIPYYIVNNPFSKRG